MRLVTPFYCKGLGKMVAALPGNTGKKAAGYQYGGLDARNVISPLGWQLRKLWFGGNSDALVSAFDDHVSTMINRGELRGRTLLTMQDYMPKSVQAGKNAGMRIWSDQILNSSRPATDRISLHYRMAGIEMQLAHDESRNDVILSLADMVTVPSRYTLAGIEGRMQDSASLHVVPYGVDRARFGIESRKSGDAIRVIARANSVRKGGHILLDAMEECGDTLRRLAKGRDIEIVVIGAMEPALAEWLRSAKLPNGLTIRAAVFPHVSMPALLASADLFVMPSLSESMSLICIEAMQAGLPLIVTPYCGIDCFVSGAMGLMSEDTSASLSAALIQAFSRIESWEEWGRAAAHKAIDLSWDAYEAGIAEVTRMIA